MAGLINNKLDDPVLQAAEQKLESQKVVRDVLQKQFDAYGNVTTRTPKHETRQHRFNRAIGFVATGEDEYDVFYKLDRIRKPVATVDPHLEPLVAEIGEALAWYDAIGTAEALAKVTAKKAALLRMLSLGEFDIGDATKH
jgi:hypothetical protein